MQSDLRPSGVPRATNRCRSGRVNRMADLLYFDVTDIVEYAHHNSRVSGIQRVQARAIASMAARHGERIRCTFVHPQDRRVYTFTASDVFAGSEFSSMLLLYRLGFASRRRFPRKAEIKKYLIPYKHNKLLRAVKKTQVYLAALLSPERVKRLGVQHEYIGSREKVAHREVVDLIAADSRLVFLGANWTYPELIDFSQRHLEQGGDVIQMIYDLIPDRAPEFCSDSLVSSFRNFLRNTPTFASRFMCISDWSRKEYLEFLASMHVQKEVVTVPLAHEFEGYARNDRSARPDDAHVARLAGTRYVLCVGTLERRKNGISLLRVWSRLASRLGDKLPTLVFAGKYGQGIDEFLDELRSQPVLKERVRLINNPSDRDLAFLYQHCLFTAFPSLYEGWGLPVGEAAWFGKYCIASSATSLPEVCGDLSDYVDPHDVDQLADAVERTVLDPTRLAAKEAAIRAHALRTWSDVADDIFTFVTRAPSAIGLAGTASCR